MSRESAGSIADVRIEPVEPLLFGDNRSARAGLDHLQADQDPSPLAIHGALGRLLAGDPASAWPDALLGPWQEDILRPAAAVAELVGWCCEDAEGRLLFPRPLHLRCRRSRRGALEAIEPLRPAAEEATRTSAGLRQLVLAESEGDEHHGAVWLSEDALGDALTGGVPELGLFEEADLFRREPRPGIAVDNDRGTVFEGFFFTRPYRRFRPGDLDPARDSKPGFRAWVRTLEPLADLPRGGLGFLGGDRRRARFSVVERFSERVEVLPALRERIESAAPESRGFSLYLLTPAVAEGAPPFRPAGAGEPAAVVVGKPRHVSGWDVRRRRPRELLALIPEGSVFFYEWPTERDRVALVRERWLAPVGAVGAAAGFGRALVGVW